METTKRITAILMVLSPFGPPLIWYSIFYGQRWLLAFGALMASIVVVRVLARYSDGDPPPG